MKQCPLPIENSLLLNKFCIHLFCREHPCKAKETLSWESEYYCTLNTRLLQVLLDNICSVRTVPAPLLWGYYESSEAPFTPRFTPPRARARGAHHLAGTQHGVESPHNQLGEWSEQTD